MGKNGCGGEVTPSHVVILHPSFSLRREEDTWIEHYRLHRGEARRVRPLIPQTNPIVPSRLAPNMFTLVRFA